jgi:uncharacterized protein (DUF697 family)
VRRGARTVLLGLIGRIIRLRNNHVQTPSMGWGSTWQDQHRALTSIVGENRSSFQPKVAAWHRLTGMLALQRLTGLSRRARLNRFDRVVGPARDDLKGFAMAEKPITSMGAETTSDTPESRNLLASKLVERFALWSGVAGLIPVPVFDVLAVGGLQLQMLNRLSQVYGVAFAQNRGKALIASLAGSWIPATSGIGAASALKAVPVLGSIVSGFVMPVLSAGATYAIGRAFIQHFESGGTLLDFNPPDYREFVKGQKEMWDSRSKSSSSGAETSKGAAATSS